MPGGDNWTGGYNYLLNLLSVLLEYAPQNITPVLFVGENHAPAALAPFRALRGIEIICSASLDQDREKYRLLKAVLFGIDLDAQKLFVKNNIDVVFEAATFYGRKFDIPCIAWLPDFQHRHLREFFGLFAWWKRELGYRAQIRSGRLVMLSSKAARKDCETFYPSSIGRTAVVHFSVNLNRDGLRAAPKSEREIYNLPSRYFYMPNQFWKHKNHKLIIDALKILKEQDIEFCVAASGLANDYRFPGYYQSLKDEVITSGLRDQFRFLGNVPYSHLLALMKDAIAVINPSLFEGWSTTVEEAKALGLPLLLSGIEVHKEQNASGALYFDPHSAQDAARVLREAMAASGVNHESRDIDVRCRLAKFAGEFVALALKAVSAKGAETQQMMS